MTKELFNRYNAILKQQVIADPKIMSLVQNVVRVSTIFICLIRMDQEYAL